MYINYAKVLAAAAVWILIGNRAMQTGDEIATGVVDQGPFWGNDQYDRPYGEVLKGVPQILSIFPNLQQTSGNLFGSTVTTSQSYQGSDNQATEVAQALLLGSDHIRG